MYVRVSFSPLVEAEHKKGKGNWYELEEKQPRATVANETQKQPLSRPSRICLSGRSIHG